MNKVLVIRNTDNQKYYTGRYWDFDEAWNREIKAAETYNSIDEIEQLLNKDDEDDSYTPFDELNECIFEVVTIYIKE